MSMVETEIVELDDGEIICDSCKGLKCIDYVDESGKINGKCMCIKCYGEGKLTWIENVFGKISRYSGYTGYYGASGVSGYFGMSGYLGTSGISGGIVNKNCIVSTGNIYPGGVLPQPPYESFDNNSSGEFKKLNKNKNIITRLVKGILKSSGIIIEKKERIV